MAKRRERRRQAYGPVLVKNRTARGWSQRQLAAIAGVEAGHIAAIEAGWILWPGPEFLARVDAAFAGDEEVSA